jgi:glycosyltransferase involved in cell wall biosynthesis
MSERNGSREITRIAFVYLGRRGALGRFTFELGQAAARAENLEAELIISDNNEIASEFERLDLPVTLVPTFERATPSSLALGFPKARRSILDRLALSRPHAVVTLMPHVWSPLLAPAIRRKGITYATIVHDAVAHPGDPTAWATRWLLQDARRADLVIALSRGVGEQLVDRNIARRDCFLQLFHPDMEFGSGMPQRERDAAGKVRLLLFGRIMAYKGLPLLLDALEILRNEGHPFHFGVYGSGNIDSIRARLAALDTEVENRWIGDDEVSRILARFDVMVCSHVEASQSGVAATAFGNGMPVVAMPVGGLAEQVIDGRTGVLARETTARSLADAIRRLSDAKLYAEINKQLRTGAVERSMGQFVADVAAGIERSTSARRRIH